MWTPKPSDIITAEQKQAQAQMELTSFYAAEIQKHVDAAAVSKLFNDGVTLASYVASTNPAWAAQAQTFVAWRDAVWLYSYTELDKVISGHRERPEIEDFIAELPPIVWPA